MKYLKFTFAILLIQLFLNTSVFCQADLKPKVSVEQIDSLFSSWNDETKPGIALGIVSNGEITHLRGYGSANLEYNIPITAQTKFHYVGMSDQIIAFSLLLMEENGDLSLDDKIRLHLPTLPPVMDEIKIHHLLNHTSGLYDLTVLRQLAGWQDSDEFTVNHKEWMLNNMSGLEAKPGKKYLSTRLETKLISDIIENVKGQTLNEYVQKNIFSPLGMMNSLFVESSVQVIPNRAQGYYQNNEGYVAADDINDKGQANLFYSTVEDMCKWAQNLSRPVVGTKEMLTQFESFVMIDGSPAEQENTSQYIGQHRYWNFNGTKKLYLIGMQAGHACKLVRFPDQDLSIVVMGNAGSYNGHWSSFAAELYLDDYFTFPNDPTPKKNLAFSAGTEQLEKYVGTYWNDEDLYSTHVSIKDDTLRYFEEEFNWRMDLIPVEQNKFITSRGHTINFVKTNNQHKLELIMPSGQASTSKEYNGSSNRTYSIENYTGMYVNQAYDSNLIIKENEGELVLSHYKLGTHELVPIHKSSFKTNHRVLKYLKFKTDGSGKRILTVSNGAIKDMPFVKVMRPETIN